MKITSILNMTQCSTADSNRRCEETRWLHFHSGRLWNGGSTFQWNTCPLLPHNMVHYPREHQRVFTKPNNLTSNVVIHLLTQARQTASHGLGTWLREFS